MATSVIQVDCATSEELSSVKYAKGKFTDLDNPPRVLVVDGVTVDAKQRILIKNQSDSRQNGIYRVTKVGDAEKSQAFVLKKSKLNKKSLSSIVIVRDGSQAGSFWTCSKDDKGLTFEKLITGDAPKSRARSKIDDLLDEVDQFVSAAPVSRERGVAKALPLVPVGTIVNGTPAIPVGSVSPGVAIDSLFFSLPCYIKRGEMGDVTLGIERQTGTVGVAGSGIAVSGTVRLSISSHVQNGKLFLTNGSSKILLSGSDSVIVDALGSLTLIARPDSPSKEIQIGKTTIILSKA